MYYANWSIACSGMMNLFYRIYIKLRWELKI
jgi:hypothetical protein